MEDTGRRGSRIEDTGYSSDPKHPTSTTIPGGAHKPFGAKVAEFLGMDTSDNYRAVAGDGPSTAEPLPAEGEMGSGHVHKAADTATMEGPGGRRISIAGPTAGEEIGSTSSADTKHQYADDTTGESRFAAIPGTASTSAAQGERSEADIRAAYNGQGRDAGTYHDAATDMND